MEDLCTFNPHMPYYNDHTYCSGRENWLNNESRFDSLFEDILEEMPSFDYCDDSNVYIVDGFDCRDFDIDSVSMDGLQFAGMGDESLSHKYVKPGSYSSPSMMTDQDELMESANIYVNEQHEKDSQMNSELWDMFEIIDGVDGVACCVEDSDNSLDLIKPTFEALDSSIFEECSQDADGVIFSPFSSESSSNVECQDSSTFLPSYIEMLSSNFVNELDDLCENIRFSELEDLLETDLSTIEPSIDMCTMENINSSLDNIINYDYLRKPFHRMSAISDSEDFDCFHHVNFYHDKRDIVFHPSTQPKMDYFLSTGKISSFQEEYNQMKSKFSNTFNGRTSSRFLEQQSFNPAAQILFNFSGKQNKTTSIDNASNYSSGHCNNQFTDSVNIGLSSDLYNKTFVNSSTNQIQYVANLSESSSAMDAQMEPNYFPKISDGMNTTTEHNYVSETSIEKYAQTACIKKTDCVINSLWANMNWEKQNSSKYNCASNVYDASKFSAGHNKELHLINLDKQILFDLDLSLPEISPFRSPDDGWELTSMHHIKKSKYVNDTNSTSSVKNHFDRNSLDNEVHVPNPIDKVSYNTISLPYRISSCPSTVNRGKKIQMMHIHQPEFANNTVCISDESMNQNYFIFNGKSNITDNSQEMLDERVSCFSVPNKLISQETMVSLPETPLCSLTINNEGLQRHQIPHLGHVNNMTNDISKTNYTNHDTQLTTQRNSLDKICIGEEERDGGFVLLQNENLAKPSENIFFKDLKDIAINVHDHNPQNLHFTEKSCIQTCSAMDDKDNIKIKPSTNHAGVIQSNMISVDSNTVALTFLNNGSKTNSANNEAFEENNGIVNTINTQILILPSDIAGNDLNTVQLLSEKEMSANKHNKIKAIANKSGVNIQSKRIKSAVKKRPLDSQSDKMTPIVNERPFEVQSNMQRPEVNISKHRSKSIPISKQNQEGMDKCRCPRINIGMENNFVSVKIRDILYKKVKDVKNCFREEQKKSVKELQQEWKDHRKLLREMKRKHLTAER